MGRRRKLDDDPEWRDAVFANWWSQSTLKSRALLQAGQARVEGDPLIVHSDLDTARNYLRACMDNMTLEELRVLKVRDVIGLLARGTLGAARYRQRGAARLAGGDRDRPRLRRGFGRAPGAVMLMTRTRTTRTSECLLAVR